MSSIQRGQDSLLVERYKIVLETLIQNYSHRHKSFSTIHTRKHEIHTKIRCFLDKKKKINATTNHNFICNLGIGQYYLQEHHYSQLKRNFHDNNIICEHLFNFLTASLCVFDYYIDLTTLFHQERNNNFCYSLKGYLRTLIFTHPRPLLTL